MPTPHTHTRREREIESERESERVREKIREGGREREMIIGKLDTFKPTHAHIHMNAYTHTLHSTPQSTETKTARDHSPDV